ncbi:SIS domain-containing protein [Streptomyces sp. H27-S2]|nr:SIS domain-containing protein [Streptomyces sp. H27-S2]MCY0949965.1 SIS domain-containing protein [Streptomyces sp. H27-S2]
MADKDEAAASVAGDKMVDEVVERLLDKADASGAALLGEGGLLTEITKAVLERALEAEMSEHLGFLPDRAVERTAQLTHLARRDAVVLFDYRRYEEDKAAIAQMTREAGGKVIVFTDAWLSPATSQADVVLPSQVGTVSPYDSLVPTLAVVETVIAGVMRALGEDAHRHMQQSEDTARRAGLV